MVTRDRRGDGGFTVVELLVAMSLLLVGLVMFGSVLFTVQQASRRQLDLGRANDDARIAFQELDRQMRSGYVTNALNPISGADASVKLYTEISGTPRCVAWVLYGAGSGPQGLYTRTWNPGASAPAFGGSGWRLVATDIVNTAYGADGTTFVTTEGATVTNQATGQAVAISQALEVTLWVNPSIRPEQVVKLQSSFATRNALRAGEKVTGAAYARTSAC